VTRRVARDSVLIVDDDPDLRSLVVMLGQACEVRMLEAENCNSALKVIEREHSRIKLILLDYFMPGAQPEKCAAKILEQAGPDIPVVLVTAAVDAAERAAALRIDRWVSKPFETAALMTLLRQAPAQ
jgi:CheY-like chemotaxis protein